MQECDEDYDDEQEEYHRECDLYLNEYMSELYDYK